MKILVCGDRFWSNREVIRERLGRFKGQDILIIHGAARGADTIGGAVGVALGFEVMAIPAEWDKFGKSAGPIRNLKMLDMKPDLVLAFHNNIAISKGTAHTVREAEKRGIKVELITERLCYSDHNEDIRTKGSCDYCRGTERIRNV